MKKKPKSPQTKLVDAAFRRAARKVIERAEASGTPVIVWVDGAVKAVDPRELRISRTKRNGRSTGK
jgi:hypothetical protein